MTDDLSSRSRTTPCFLRDQAPHARPNEVPETNISPLLNNSLTKNSQWTPDKATLKNSKKGGRKPELFRASPTLSHEAKMSSIFQDAAQSLKALDASPMPASSNIKKVRMPLQQVRMTPFGCSGRKDSGSPPVQSSSRQVPKSTSLVQRAVIPPDVPCGVIFPYPLPVPYPLPDHRAWSNPYSSSDEAKESDGSNYSRPVIANHGEKIDCNQGFGEPTQWKLRKLPSIPSSFGSDCHSSHRVPLVIPLSNAPKAKVEDIDSWLTELTRAFSPSLADPSPERQRDSMPEGIDKINASPSQPVDSPSPRPRLLMVPPRKPKVATPSRSADNNENSHPLYPILPSNNASPPYSPPSTPSTNHKIFQATSDFKRSKARSPANIHSLPHARIPSINSGPQRKRARLSDVVCKHKLARRTNMDPTVESLDDRRAAQSTGLSPDVERHRKGRGPKRGRCPSYWDTDIMNGDAGTRSVVKGHDANENEHNDKSGEQDGKGGDGGFTWDGRKILGECERNGEAAQPEKVLEAEEAASLFSADW